jgi:hypothetical protein
MEYWFAFRAYNAQTRYGFGTITEAERYADHLNTHVETNHFAPRVLMPDEITDLKLESGDLGFSLSIALTDSEA